jgi:pyruvate formate lyase activating enzyme
VGGQLQGLILDIEKLAVHDGPGIRTAVFMKGCPLRCTWCHAPESQSARPERGFLPRLCVDGCSDCLRACPHRALQPSTNGGGRKITIDRQRCSLCGSCVKACPTGAMAIIGAAMTVDQVFAEVRHAPPYAPHPRGGVTVSGGEPLTQWAFVRALLRRCREHGIPTALETCGHGPWEHLSAILEFTDLLLYDLKVMDTEQHARLTGVPNGLILENLCRASALGVPIVIRVPLIRGYTDSERNVRTIGELARRLRSVVRVELLPHHGLRETKYRWLDRGDRRPPISAPPDPEVKAFRSLLVEMGHHVGFGG